MADQTDQVLSGRKAVDTWLRMRVLLVLVIIGAHLPLLTAHLMSLWRRPHFRFLPVLLAVAVYLIWRRWPRRQEVPFVRAPVLESVLLGLSLLLLGVGLLLSSPFLGAIAAIFAFGFVVIYFAGVRAIESCLGVWALLWVMIPPPLGFDLALIARMQAWTSSHASAVLDLMGIDHLMSGNVLSLADKTFLVDEACSGVHSLFALFGYTAVFVVLTSRGFRRGMFLLAATIPWALLLNMLRIVTIALCHSRWQIDLSTGWSHEILGIVTFVIALSLTLSTDQLLRVLGYGSWTAMMSVRRWMGRQGRHGSASHRVIPVSEQPIIPARHTFPAPAMGVFALCVYGVMLMPQVTGATSPGPRDTSWSALTDVTEDAMPISMMSLQRQDFEAVERDWSSDLGVSSRIWTYAEAPLRCVVSADFPFYGWHELTRCYEGSGWQLQERTVHSQPEGGWHTVEATFIKESGEHAFLVYALLNHRGDLMTPPHQLGMKRFLDRVRQQTTVQVQVFCPSDDPLMEAERDDVRMVFRDAIQNLRPFISK